MVSFEISHRLNLALGLKTAYVASHLISPDSSQKTGIAFIVRKTR